MTFLNHFIAKTLPFIPKSIVGQVSKRYIAGTTFDAAVAKVRELNSKGMMATLDILGEDIHEREPALELVKQWTKVVEDISKEGLNSNISVKLSQLGLKIDVEFCHDNVRTIVRKAKELGNFVRIDMEDSATTDATLGIYRRLLSEGFENIGIVIQAYLFRSDADIRELIKLGANFRLCKGIYIESPDIAYRDREDVRRNFVLLLRTIIENGAYVGVATHDDYLMEKAYELIQRNGLPKDRYEFQMLLGVKEALRDRIVRDGHRLRVYVPFGELWYAYSVRRLKENPEIAGYVLKAMLHRNGS